MHRVSYGGPLLYILWFVAYASAAGAAFVAVDSLRRPGSRFGAPLWRWAWFLPQAGYLTLFVLDYVPSLTPHLGGVVVALMPVVIVLQVAYLLRVVWPSPKRLARMQTAEDGDGVARAAGAGGTEHDGHPTGGAQTLRE